MYAEMLLSSSAQAACFGHSSSGPTVNTYDPSNGIHRDSFDGSDCFGAKLF